MSEWRAVHGTVSGRVQGVGYRASFQREASTLGLVGWIRNRSDGTVEFLVQGAPGPVRTMLAWAQTGSTLARVTDVQIRDVDSDPTLVSLEVRS